MPKKVKEVTQKKEPKAKWKPANRSKYVNSKSIMEPDGYVTPPSSKFMGYCPECSGMLSELDFEEGKKFIVICPCCHTRNRTKALNREKVAKVEHHDEKEYTEMLEKTYSEPKTQHDDVPLDLRPHIENESYD